MFIISLKVFRRIANQTHTNIVYVEAKPRRATFCLAERNKLQGERICALRNYEVVVSFAAANKECFAVPRLVGREYVLLELFFEIQHTTIILLNWYYYLDNNSLKKKLLTL